MKTNFKSDTVEYLITTMLESLQNHQAYEKELQKTEHPLFLLGYNRQKLILIEESLKYIKKYITSQHESDTGV